MEKGKNKVVIIGAGYVGTTTAFTLMHSSLISEMVLIDINEEKVKGEVMDLNHGLSFVKPMEISVGDYSQCRGANIIIMTAGPSMEPGETRLSLAKKNSEIMRSVMGNVMKYTNDAVILIATNPVDVLTYAAAKESGYDRNKIIGSGTVLDSSRFRYLLSEHFNIDARNIHGYIIGEHGDSEVAAWSLTNVAGVNMDHHASAVDKDFTDEDKKKIFENVKDAGYQIIEKKGVSNYAVALAIKRITEAILRDENAVLTVSSMIEGLYEIQDVALSLPSIINRSGIKRVLQLPLDEEELIKLHKSAEKLKETIKLI